MVLGVNKANVENKMVCKEGQWVALYGKRHNARGEWVAKVWLNTVPPHFEMYVTERGTVSLKSGIV